MKDQFLRWLEIERQLKQRGGNKQSFVLANAIKSLRAAPGEYAHPSELAPLKYFGQSIIAMLTTRMKRWCEETGREYTSMSPPQDVPLESQKAGSPSKRSMTDATTHALQVDPKPKRRRTYRPAFKSGGFAIVMVLHHHDTAAYGLHKSEIILHAQKYTDAPFTTTTAGKSYTAWTSIKTLLANDLVEKIGNPPRYALTDAGHDMAEALDLAWNAHEGTTPVTPVDPVERPLRQPRQPLDNGDNPVASSSNPNTANNSMLAPKDWTPPLQSSPAAKRAKSGTLADPDQTIWPAGSYDIVFVLDKREVAIKSDRELFYNDLRRRGVDVEHRNLPVGDGAWIAVHRTSHQEAILDHLFERKRLTDLVSSIMDNRFREQESRLRKCGLKRIMYLVEDDSTIDGDPDKVKTAMAMMDTHLKATLVRTPNYEATVRYIVDFDKVVAHKYHDRDLLVIHPTHTPSQDDYLSTLEQARIQNSSYEVVYKYDIFDSIMQKRATLRVKDVFIQCLTRIRGMSLDKAVMIQRKFKTPKSLLKALQSHSAPSLMLYELFANEVGTRRITAALSERIWDSIA